MGLSLVESVDCQDGTAGFELKLESICQDFSQRSSSKEYPPHNDDHDPLMDMYSMTPELKRENPQYWGSQLGANWQRLVAATFYFFRRPDYGPPIQYERTEPFDFRFGKIVVDTKYRVGSHDSGTLNKFRLNGIFLNGEGFHPVALILRHDTHRGAITQLLSGGWEVFVADEAFDYIREQTSFDLETFLQQRAHKFAIDRISNPHLLVDELKTEIHLAT
jgi:hypothetical protein